MRIELRGKPRGKERPRFYRGYAVTPKDTREYEDLLAATWKAHKCGYYGDKPVKVSMRAYFLVPKSYTKKKKLMIALGVLFPVIRPDADNIAKIVLDGLNGIAYKDDSQVVKLQCIKRYTFSQEREGIIVDIEEVGNNGLYEDLYGVGE